MKSLLNLMIAASLLFSCSNNGTGKQVDGSDQALTTAVDTSKKSITTQVSKQVGSTDININYHAPAVRGRVIWGGLVPYDEVWVTGAHKATSLEVGKDFTIGETQIPGGKYAIFTIPGKDEWTVIINKNWNQHLTDSYSEKDDVARLKVKPQTMDGNAERLKYDVEQTGEKTAEIIVSWERIRVPFRIEIN